MTKPRCDAPTLYTSQCCHGACYQAGDQRLCAIHARNARVPVHWGKWMQPDSITHGATIKEFWALVLQCDDVLRHRLTDGEREGLDSATEEARAYLKSVDPKFKKGD